MSALLCPAATSRSRFPLARGKSGGAGPAPLGVLVDSVQVGRSSSTRSLSRSVKPPLSRRGAGGGICRAGGQAGDNLVLHAEATQVLRTPDME